MIDHDTIERLGLGQAISAAADAITDQVDNALVALPAPFALHDLENFAHIRRRARGSMTTSVLAHFAQYATTYATTEGAAVFVDADAMAAVAVLNLGTPHAPGHADNTATLQLRRTAAFASLLDKARGLPLKQQEAAEWLEDWAHCVACSDANGPVETRRAVAALRRITLEGIKRLESAEQNLGASRSAFESVQATSTEPIPTSIDFRCQPYYGLAERTIRVRLGVLTGDKPTIVLRAVNMEQHRDDMAAELASLVEGEFAQALPVHIGTYKPKA